MSEYLKFGQFLFLLDLLPGGRALLPPPSPLVELSHPHYEQDSVMVAYSGNF